MKIKQLSIFVENRKGRLAEITATLKEKNIDIRALSLADTSDFGILRLIVDSPDKACAALKEAGIMVRTTEVIAVRMDDKPGSFSDVVRLLADAGVNIEYLYAFLGRTVGEAVVILRAEHPEAAIGALSTKGVRLMKPEEVYAP